ncbi:MAG: hypothetical protein KA264_09320 [Crocinitomicaceae bacterium]|jgi:hypothetical protein|nr:hypothetical protein [Crocinitomicaceae bacterium]
MRISIILFFIVFSLSACWPTSVSFTDTGSMPIEWKIFSISPLENNAPNAPISYTANLADELRDGIQNNTRLKLSSTPNSGEVRIEGNVTNYSITPIALQPGDNAAKNRLTINANFKIHILAPKEQELTVNCSRFSDYSSDSDLSSVEANLINEINKQIVQDVINKLLSNW